MLFGGLPRVTDGRGVLAGVSTVNENATVFTITFPALSVTPGVLATEISPELVPADAAGVR